MNIRLGPVSAAALALMLAAPAFAQQTTRPAPAMTPNSSATSIAPSQQQVDRADYGPIREEIFGKKMPAHTLVAVAALAAPEYLIEVEAVAVI